eukprot:scaffold3747_cov240-Pinguiococcus_pyrenoidosus.AAC.12
MSSRASVPSSTTAPGPTKQSDTILHGCALLHAHAVHHDHAVQLDALLYDAFAADDGVLDGDVRGNGGGRPDSAVLPGPQGRAPRQGGFPRDSGSRGPPQERPVHLREALDAVHAEAELIHVVHPHGEAAHTVATLGLEDADGFGGILAVRPACPVREFLRRQHLGGAPLRQEKRRQLQLTSRVLHRRCQGRRAPSRDELGPPKGRRAAELVVHHVGHQLSADARERLSLLGGQKAGDPGRHDIHPDIPVVPLHLQPAALLQQRLGQHDLPRIRGLAGHFRVFQAPRVQVAVMFVQEMHLVWRLFHGRLFAAWDSSAAPQQHSDVSIFAEKRVQQLREAVFEQDGRRHHGKRAVQLGPKGLFRAHLEAGLEDGAARGHCAQVGAVERQILKDAGVVVAVEAVHLVQEAPLQHRGLHLVREEALHLRQVLCGHDEEDGLEENAALGQRGQLIPQERPVTERQKAAGSLVRQRPQTLGRAQQHGLQRRHGGSAPGPQRSN